MHRIRLSVMIGVLSVLMCSQFADGAHTYHTLTMKGGSTLEYALVLPEEHDPDKTYPTLLALPDGNEAKADVETGLRRYWGEHASDLGWIVISPIAPERTSFSREAALVIPDLLDAISAQHKIEGGKFHIAGGDKGGRNAFHIATMFPERFCSITTAPGLPKSTSDILRLDRLKGMVVVMHIGDGDEAYQRRAKNILEKLNKLNVHAVIVPSSSKNQLPVSLTGPQFMTRLDALRAYAQSSPNDLPYHDGIFEFKGSNGAVIRYAMSAGSAFVKRQPAPTMIAFAWGHHGFLQGWLHDSPWRTEAQFRGWVIIAPLPHSASWFFDDDMVALNEFFDALIESGMVKENKFVFASPGGTGYFPIKCASTRPSQTAALVAAPGFSINNDDILRLNLLKQIPKAMFCYETKSWLVVGGGDGMVDFCKSAQHSVDACEEAGLIPPEVIRVEKENVAFAVFDWLAMIDSSAPWHTLPHRTLFAPPEQEITLETQPGGGWYRLSIDGEVYDSDHLGIDPFNFVLSACSFPWKNETIIAIYGDRRFGSGIDRRPIDLLRVTDDGVQYITTLYEHLGYSGSMGLEFTVDVDIAIQSRTPLEFPMQDPILPLTPASTTLEVHITSRSPLSAQGNDLIIDQHLVFSDTDAQLEDIHAAIDAAYAETEQACKSLLDQARRTDP